MQMTGFNPRPASMPGDPPYPASIEPLRDVSIRARHRCRAIPNDATTPAWDKTFQSAPGIDAGRSDAAWVDGWITDMFQSAPGIDAGRSVQRVASSTPALSGFNPRPASMPGDPTDRSSIRLFLIVSIRARHRCRAIRFACSWLLSKVFSTPLREPGFSTWFAASI